MDEQISVAEGALWALVAAGTALWGWYGWLLITWAGLMVLDYLTGSLAAARAGEWSSARAREGLWHKGGEICMVTVGLIADVFLGLSVRYLAIPLPPSVGHVLIGPIVTAWYSVTELGSIAENASLMGGPVPRWLLRVLKVAGEAVDKVGDKAAGDDSGPRE